MIWCSGPVCSAAFLLTANTSHFLSQVQQHLNVKFSTSSWNRYAVSLLQVPPCYSCWDETLTKPRQACTMLLRLISLTPQLCLLTLVHQFKPPTALQSKGHMDSFCLATVALYKIQVARKHIQDPAFFNEEDVMILCLFTKSGSQINEPTTIL